MLKKIMTFASAAILSVIIATGFGCQYQTNFTQTLRAQDWDEIYVVDNTAIIKLHSVYSQTTIPQIDAVETADIWNLRIDIFNMGGGLGDMFAIVDRLEKYKERGGSITTVSYGGVGSAGALIFLAGDRRYFSEHSVLMLHPHSAWNKYDTEGDYYKIIADNPTTKTLYEKMSKKWAHWYAGYVADRTDLAFDEAFKYITSKDADSGQWWFTAYEALEMGFIHAII